MPLSTYVLDTQLLLHDTGATFTTPATIARYCNQARRQAAQWTGCIQRLISGASAFGASAQPGAFIPGGAQPGALPGSAPNAQVFQTVNTFQTIPGVERYPFQGFANPYLQAQHEGCNAIMDVATVSVSWGGSVRPTLDFVPWEWLQAYCRAYATLVESYPYYWSTLNDGENGEVWLFPVPSFPMELEWLVYATPMDLADDNTYDAIPAGMRNAIPDGAASYVFLGKQMYGQAQMMEGMFKDRLGIGRVASDRGKIPSFYQSA